MNQWGVLVGVLAGTFAAQGHIYNELTVHHNQFVHGYNKYVQDLELPSDTEYPLWEPGESACPLSSQQAIDLAEYAATNLIEGIIVDHKQRYVSLIKRDAYWFYEIQFGLTATNGTPRARSNPITIAVGLDGKVPEFKTIDNASRRFGGGFRRAGGIESEPAEEITDEEKAQRREEVRANLKQYQMEVIRAGMPPLPIPLTVGMDEQLVKEGYFPPQETSNKLSHPPLDEGWTNSIPDERPKSGVKKH